MVWKFVRGSYSQQANLFTNRTVLLREALSQEERLSGLELKTRSSAHNVASLLVRYYGWRGGRREAGGCFWFLGVELEKRQ